MPTKIRVQLTAAQWAEIERAQHATVIDRRLWLRLEMVRHAALSRSIPAAAAGLGLHPQTVRHHVKAFLAGGVAALADEPRSGRPPKLTEAVLTALEARLDNDAANGTRTWTLPQLAAWLAEEHGVVVNAAYLGEVLKRRDFRRKRTKRSSRHRQTDDDRQDRKAADLALLPFCRGAPRPA
jgi:putative transposase